ncbi:MAG: CHAT domain-containing protein [Agriterribacter sp.]
MKFLLALLCIFFSFQLLAQEQGNIDSAKYYVSKGQEAKALPFAKNRFESIKDSSNNNITYISFASIIADIYRGIFKPDSALVYYIKAGERIKKQYGDNSEQYGTSLVQIAAVYSDMGQYQESDLVFQQASTILAKIENSNKRSYVMCLTEYAAFYITTGRLNKAEELCLMASDIALKGTVDKLAYILVLEKMGGLYERMGLYSKQEAVVLKYFEMAKELYGEKTPKYASSLSGLAGLYQHNHKLEKADSLYKRVLEAKEKIFGKNAAANITILNHLGLVNMEMKKYKTAEQYFKSAVDIISENGGEESPMYPYCVKNLAKLYALSGRKALAEPLFQKSLATYNRLGLTLHAGRVKLLYDMAGLLYANDAVKAPIYLKEAMDAENKLLLEKLDYLSETELLLYLKRIKEVSDKPYHFLLRYKNSEIISAVYNSRLFASGIGLQNTRTLYENMAQSKDSTLATLWKNYLQQKASYTKLMLTPAAQRNTNMDSVDVTLNQQEKNILRRSADYRNMKEKLSVKWQDVQSHLQPGEAAIEFVRFNRTFNLYDDTKADTFLYAALLVRPEDKAPQFVVLCEEKQLIAGIKKFPYKAMINSRGEQQEGNAENVTNILFKLLWQPLEPYLIHTKGIYFSPDGILHRVAFSAIPYSKHQLLCDKYQLIQLTSTRQVALRETKTTAPVSIAMFGGINYSHQSIDTGSEMYANSYNKNRGVDLDSFSYLPHTLKEINTIKTEAEALQKHALVFTADNATEAAFRNLGGNNSPEAIHFATHGFTLPDSSSQTSHAGAFFKASHNPLLRCGLIMAGGNKGWKGTATVNEDDGILTGLEISSVQLPNTQLAVLSACETGLGKIEGSEGVFGLQRAFKLSGVNYVMASLWQVPDKETAEFMETFYSCWLGGKTIRDAFFNTQQMMRKKYAPYYWAGFTLVQ